MTVNDNELEKIKEKMMKEMMNSNPDADGTVKVLTGQNLQEFISKNKFAIVDFYATWCPPCKIMDPITREIAEKYKDKAAFGKINTDQNQTAAMQYQIRYIPTFYLFKDGNIITNFSGAKRKKDFIEIIEKLLKE
jgi:thioredoxin 1